MFHRHFRRVAPSLLTLVATLMIHAVTDGQARPRRTRIQFRQGELYLCSRSIPNLSGTGSYEGIVHVSIATGAVSPLFGGPNVDFFTATANMVYDPYRDRLLVSGRLNGQDGLYKINVNGRHGSLGFAAPPACMAATGDGRVYISYGGPDLWLLSSTGMMSLVLDQTGTAPAQTTVPMRELFYDSSTESLINVFSASDCALTDDRMQLYRIPLSSDGTQLIGAPTVTSTCIVGRSNGICNGPSGQMFMTFDNNVGDSVARMVTLDPVTLAVSTFACNGPYIGAPTSDAGTYSFALGKAIILDTFNDVLRTFDYDPACMGNNGGLGSILASSGLSGPGGHSESATLVAIERF